jgi:iron-sulfur cluster assembly accessory protein
MSVATFDPQVVQMTPRAAEHARRQILRNHSAGIRLGVRKAGCSGYMYDVELVQAPADDDERFTIADDVVVFVARDAVPIVAGTEIDYVTEGLNSSLKFRNPNATGECGCGESFKVD